MLMRHLGGAVRAALADTPVVLIVGPRQAGKSTLARQVAPEARYVTLDDAAVLAAVSADPQGFVRGLEGPAVLDEVQRVPELFLALKAEVDRDRRPGRFLLTGSADVLLLPRVSESLAGRMEVLTLWPFSQGEVEGRVERFIDGVFAPKLAVNAGPGESRATVLARAVAGGFPEVLSRATPARRQAWFRSYATTLLVRDVRDLAGIEGLTQLPRLLRLLAARTMSTLNAAGLSADLGMPQTTLRRYLQLLEATFLVQQLPAWSGSQARRLVRSPRVMLADSGLVAHLTGATPASLETSPDLAGPLVENFVAMELRKATAWSEASPSLHFFRTHGGAEVDLVLEDAAGRVVGIEVKAAASVAASDFRGLRVLQEGAGRRFRRGVLLYTGTQVLPFGDDLVAVPIPALWSTT
jgi:predicted AAA+ superfamily ATPase